MNKRRLYSLGALSTRWGAAVIVAVAVFAAGSTVPVRAGFNNSSLIANAYSPGKYALNKALRQKQHVPQTPNPYLSLLPAGARPDYEYWRSQMKVVSLDRKKVRQAQQAKFAPSAALLAVGETEAVGVRGVNDTQATAQNIPGFGTGNGDDASADIAGNLKTPDAPTSFSPLAEDEGDINKASPTGLADESGRMASGTIGDGPYGSVTLTPVSIGPFAEDDGDINKASDTGIVSGQEVTALGEIGDGPFGSATLTPSGDFDVYAFTVPAEGKQVEIEVNRQAGETQFDAIVAVFDSSGSFLFGNDDATPNLESALSINFTCGTPPCAATTYYIFVGSWSNNGALASLFPSDPFDSSTGPGANAGSEGSYELVVRMSDFVSGDFDFYSFSANAGDVVSVEVDTSNYGAVLDTIAALYDSAGNLLALNDDDPNDFNTYDSYISFVAPYTDTFYVSVGGFNDAVYPTSALSFLANPFDSSTGPGLGSEGDYDIILQRNAVDIDYYSFDLEAGDILGMNVVGGAPQIAFFAENSDMLVSTGFETSGIYPASSPLPGGGDASMAYVAPEAGTYAVAVGYAQGAYDLELRAFRPPNESTHTRQKVFLDFDGASIDTTIFGAANTSQPRSLSPLSSFLGNWGLTPGDEDAVIDAILAVFTQKMKTHILSTGNNPAFDIEILNSRDDPDPFGDPDVSRIIIGGTIDESGVQTIGIAQSIDVGNFEQAESALVLLDLLSEVPSDPNSLNGFGLAGGKTIIDLIGEAVGNIAAHEAGHFFANFHTDNSDSVPSLMDTGGNLPNLVGTGLDGIYGSGDDVSVKFSTDAYDPFESFSGQEDTKNAIAFGLSTGKTPLEEVFALDDLNGNGKQEVAAVLPGSVRVVVRDGSTDALISDVDFGNEAGAAMAVIGDINGNGAQELALLANRDSGQVVVLIRDSLSGALLNTIFYGTAFTGVDLAVLPDSDSNGADELAVLGADSGGGLRVQARDALSDAVTSTTYYGNTATPVDVAVIPDISGNGAPEIVVHATVIASGQTRSQIRDSASGAFIRNVFFGNTYAPIQIAVVDDISGDGKPEIAELARRTDNGATRIQIRNPVDRSLISNAYTGNTDLPRRIVGIGDANGDTVPDVAMLVEEPGGTGKIVIRDGATGGFITNIFVATAGTPKAMARIADLDTSGDDELAVLGMNGSQYRVQIKDSVSAAQINNINFP